MKWLQSCKVAKTQRRIHSPVKYGTSLAPSKLSVLSVNNKTLYLSTYLLIRGKKGIHFCPTKGAKAILENPAPEGLRI